MMPKQCYSPHTWPEYVCGCPALLEWRGDGGLLAPVGGAPDAERAVVRLARQVLPHGVEHHALHQARVRAQRRNDLWCVVELLLMIDPELFHHRIFSFITP